MTDPVAAARDALLQAAAKSGYAGKPPAPTLGEQLERLSNVRYDDSDSAQAPAPQPETEPVTSTGIGTLARQVVEFCVYLSANGFSREECILLATAAIRAGD